MRHFLFAFFFFLDFVNFSTEKQFIISTAGQPGLTPLAARPPQHHPAGGPQGAPLGMSPTGPVPGGGMSAPNMGQHPNMPPMSQVSNLGIVYIYLYFTAISFEGHNL